MSELLTGNSSWAISLPDEWKYYLLSDLISFYVDNRGKTAPTSDNGIPLIATNCIKNENLYPVYEKIRYVSDETYDNWFRAHPEPGDIIIVNKGTPGLTVLVPDPVDFVIAQDMMAIRANEEIVYPLYLFAALRSPHFMAQVNTTTVGTTIPHLKKTDFDKLIVPIPPLNEQRFIGDLYFNFSNKIEANRRQNETLEAAARAIFKSWFVDFDPVHAKANGEAPVGMDAATAALFPDSFEDSELGAIPRGWRVVPIGDHVKANKGLSYKGAHLEETIEDGLPMHNLNSVNEWGGYKFDGIKFYSGDYKPRHEVRPGDLVVANTEQGFNLLLIASPAIIPAVFGDKGIVSHHIYKVEIKRKSPLTRLFLYYRIMMSPFRDVLQGYTNGTTVNMLPSDAFEKPRFVMPSAELMQRFDALIAPMLEQVERNYEKSTTLAETRDALLPRLVSGELRVGEVE